MKSFITLVLSLVVLSPLAQAADGINTYLLSADADLGIQVSICGDKVTAYTFNLDWNAIGDSPQYSGYLPKDFNPSSSKVQVNLPGDPQQQAEVFITYSGKNVTFQGLTYTFNDSQPNTACK